MPATSHRARRPHGDPAVLPWLTQATGESRCPGDQGKAGRAELEHAESVPFPPAGGLRLRRHSMLLLHLTQPCCRSPAPPPHATTTCLHCSDGRPLPSPSSLSPLAQTSLSTSVLTAPVQEAAGSHPALRASFQRPPLPPLPQCVSLW